MKFKINRDESIQKRNRKKSKHSTAENSFQPDLNRSAFAIRTEQENQHSQQESDNHNFYQNGYETNKHDVTSGF